MITVGFFSRQFHTVSNEGCVVVTTAFMGTGWLDRWREIQGRIMKRKV
jgi:hypothetical protein